MYVGVILELALRQGVVIGIPHVCGGDPLVVAIVPCVDLYSPCMWG